MNKGVEVVEGVERVGGLEWLGVERVGGRRSEGLERIGE